MSIKEMEKLDDQGMQAWDGHDPDAWAAMFADRFEWHDDARPEAMRTKDDARGYMQAWVDAFPDIRFKTRNRVVGTHSVAAEIEFSGTHTGPMVMGDQTIEPTNKKVTGHATYFVKEKDGQIVEFHSHPNVMEMLQQLGGSGDGG